MKYLLSIILLFLCQASLSQGIKVVDVKETISGSDAFHAPIDENGHPCGLVKVLAVFPDLQFDGNVVGDVASENNEYKVFLAKGSKKLVIKRSGVLPVIVDFPICGIPEISSKVTYTIRIKEVSLNPQKNSIIIDTKPKNAKVYIDDILIENENGDGGYQLLLSKGDHLCKVEAKGYRSYASVIKTGKGPQTINAELESLLADIDISCQTSGAHLFIDGEEFGVGSWKGKLPAGSYKVEASLEGYLPITQSIELSEKDNQVLNLPSLKRAKGNLGVQINIKDVDVYLDGNRVNNPKHIPDVQTGNHILKVKAPFGYKEVEKDITISSGDNKTIQIDMEPIDELYAKAFGGDVDAQAELCKMRYESSKFNDEDSIERNYWYERLYENIDKVDKKAFDKVWFYGGESGFSLYGIYEYIGNNHVKSVKLLHKAISFGNFEHRLLAHHYYELEKYEETILYGTKAVIDPSYGEPYFDKKIIDACLKLKDTNKGISIINSVIEEDWHDEAKCVAYEGIGDIYHKNHNNSQAVQYYKKCLQMWLKLKERNNSSVDDEINKLNNKIRQGGY